MSRPATSVILPSALQSVGDNSQTLRGSAKKAPGAHWGTASRDLAAGVRANHATRRGTMAAIEPIHFGSFGSIYA
jgi:hypothetical protein